MHETIVLPSRYRISLVRALLQHVCLLFFVDLNSYRVFILRHVFVCVPVCARAPSFVVCVCVCVHFELSRFEFL